MKNFLSITLLLALPLITQAQSPSNTPQVSTAKAFIYHLLDKDFEQCWQNFDTVINKKLSKEYLFKVMDNIYTNVLESRSKKLTLTMSGVKYVGKYETMFYRFHQKETANFFFEISFINKESLMVANFNAFRMNRLSPPPTRENKTLISKAEEITLEGKSYKIRYIGIIHFANKEGLLAVQVEQVIPQNVNQKAWAYKKGIIFAKWLFKHPSYQKAFKVAKKINRTLRSEIGVSFINPTTENGYNTMIETKDFKN